MRRRGAAGGRPALSALAWRLFGLALPGMEHAWGSCNHLNRHVLACRTPRAAAPVRPPTPAACLRWDAKSSRWAWLWSLTAAARIGHPQVGCRSWGCSAVGPSGEWRWQQLLWAMPRSGCLPAAQRYCVAHSIGQQAHPQPLPSHPTGAAAPLHPPSLQASQCATSCKTPERLGRTQGAACWEATSCAMHRWCPASAPWPA